MADSLEIRSAEPDDLEDLGAMAGALVRLHHGTDPRRFLLVPEVELGYARFFSSQLTERSTVLLVALKDGRRIGYAYARLEPRDWNALLDACGALHDIYVVPEGRSRGIASALLSEVVRRLTEEGAPRLVLHTAASNDAAQRFFERHGFRRTMIEMTRELEGAGTPPGTDR